MANKNLFKSIVGMLSPKSDTVNEAWGVAYRLSPKQALAQYAATGCFSHTFYADASEQLDKVLALANEVEPVFMLRNFVRTMRSAPAPWSGTLANTCRHNFFTQSSRSTQRLFAGSLRSPRALREKTIFHRANAGMITLLQTKRIIPISCRPHYERMKSGG